MSTAVVCGVLAIASSDARREIREMDLGDACFQDFYIKDAEKPLGQHFHRDKFEIFFFIEGGGTIRTAEVDEDGKIACDVKEFRVGPGSVIRIPPYHTHRFDLTPNSRFVAFCSKVFDPADMVACPIA